MYHKQLATHVTTKLREGLSKKQIKEELIADGWSEADVREAFYYSAYPEKLRHFSFIRYLHSEVPVTAAIAVIGLLIVVFGTSFYYFKNTIVSFSIGLPAVVDPTGAPLTFGVQPALTNPDFFGKVKQKFIDDKASFVEADLSAMKLSVYKEGAVVLEVPILSKGKEGSWWETPAGLYKVIGKEPDHFSSMGHVWMPWSLNFQGNFFIHGKTYYPDGTPTSTTFTGGCIRLDTSDAEKVYNMVDLGTPVLVFEQSFSSDNFTYADDSAVSVSAPIYLSADLGDNHVFASKDATNVVSIASITKLMTALVATEYINLDDIATVPVEAIASTSKPRLKAGDRYSVYQLLFPLLMESSNEAAETIARFYGRDAFIEHMNEKAAAIGMTHTNFSDPSGVESGNTSTAEDLFNLAKYIYNNRSFIFNITSGKITASAYGASGFSDLGNFNDFTDNEFLFGGKNGKSTAAGETNLSVFVLPVVETKRPIVLIVLGSPDEKTDSEMLLDYTLNHFR